MRRRSQGNTLLIELIVVVLFFSIAASISLGVFVQARRSEQRTALRQQAQLTARNLLSEAETRPDTETLLTGKGFTAQGDGAYVLAEEQLTWTARTDRHQQPGGTLITLTVQAETKAGDEILAPESGCCYFPDFDGEVTP